MSTPSLSGRPWRRAQAAVFATETHCWLCGQHVEQTLPPNHDRARSVDHITPLAEGGAKYDHRNFMALCHDHHTEKTTADALRGKTRSR